MVELNDEEKNKLLQDIRKDMSGILKELVQNTRQDIEKIIEENFYDNVQYDIAIDKTEELLKKYKSLTQHVNNIEFTEAEIKEAEEEQIKQIMRNLFSDDELYFEKLYKSKINTEIVVKFLQKIFQDYKKECIGSTSLSEIRKRDLLEKLYIQGISQQEILLDYTSQKTFYKDRKDLIKDLAPKICGIFALQF